MGKCAETNAQLLTVGQLNFWFSNSSWFRFTWIRVFSNFNSSLSFVSMKVLRAGKHLRYGGPLQRADNLLNLLSLSLSLSVCLPQVVILWVRRAWIAMNAAMTLCGVRLKPTPNAGIRLEALNVSASWDSTKTPAEIVLVSSAVRWIKVHPDADCVLSPVPH